MNKWLRFLDGITGSDYSFSVFYFVTVAFIAWYIGRKSSILIALSGSVSWSIADIVAKRYHENPLALIWNDVVKLSLLLFGAYVISELKSRLNSEEKLARTDTLTGIANRRRFSEAVATKMCASLKANVEAVWPVTFSIGMVTYRTAPADINEMIRLADQLMYEVKNSGKNELRHLIVPEAVKS